VVGGWFYELLGGSSNPLRVTEPHERDRMCADRLLYADIRGQVLYARMRRRHGTGLVPNEKKVLAAALRLAYEETPNLYGYELFARLRAWEGGAPMDHGTLYRCLRGLEARGFFASSVDHSTARLRVMYELTPEGTAAARKATIELAAQEEPPRWIDIRRLVLPNPGTPS